MMDISEEFAVGSLGAIVMLHGKHYATNWGFGTFFEAKVARELADFALRQPSSDSVQIAHDDDGVAASLVLDLKDPKQSYKGVTDTQARLVTAAN